jgi:hypothetical protein
VDAHVVWFVQWGVLYCLFIACCKLWTGRCCSPQCCAILSGKQVKGIYIKVYYNRSALEKKVGIVDRLVLGLVTQLQGKSCHNSNIQIRFAVIFMSHSIENTVLSNTDRYISAWMTHRNFLWI